MRWKWIEINYEEILSYETNEERHFIMILLSAKIKNVYWSYYNYDIKLDVFMHIQLYRVISSINVISSNDLYMN